MLKNFLVIFLTIFFMGFYTYNKKPLFNIEGTYCFYTSTSSSSNFIKVDSASASRVKQQTKNICGESVSFSYNKKIIDDTLCFYKASFIKEESDKNFKTEYYYSKKIPFYRLIGGVKVNIQVAYQQDLAVIGSPIIYGGF